MTVKFNTVVTKSSFTQLEQITWGLAMFVGDEHFFFFFLFDYCAHGSLLHWLFFSNEVGSYNLLIHSSTNENYSLSAKAFIFRASFFRHINIIIARLHIKGIIYHDFLKADSLNVF